MSWLNGAATEQYLVFPFGNATNHHLRVLIMNSAACRAHVPRQGVACGNTQVDRVATITAVFHKGVF